MPSYYGWDSSNTTTANTAWPSGIVYYTIRGDGGIVVSSEPPEKSIERLEEEADWML